MVMIELGITKNKGKDIQYMNGLIGGIQMTITKFNKQTTSFTHKVDGKMEYMTLQKLYARDGKGTKYPVLALYINDGKFGKEPLAVSDKQYINLPPHLVSQVIEIRETPELVEDINNLKVGLEIYEYYQEKYKKTCYGINWVVIENNFKEDTSGDDVPF